MCHAIEAVGTTILYLSPDSPAFNPIEMVVSKRKMLLKKTVHRPVDARCIELGTLRATFA